MKPPMFFMPPLQGLMLVWGVTQGVALGYYIPHLRR